MAKDIPKQPLSVEERRARKIERRAKQRIANVRRAAKMHAERLSLEKSGTKSPDAKRKSTSKQGSPPQLNVGCSGWFYWHWRDRFYPRGMKTTDWFQHYASEFGTVELNAPFYSWPTLATVQSWVRQAKGKPFVYTVKVCELITHVKQFSRTAELVKDFGLIDRLLKPHTGCFLFQLPPSFRYTPARLKRILDQLDPRLRNVVEFRHRSWWNDRVFAAFKKRNTIFCSCSAPRLPDELIQTSEDVYIRFHGTSRWYRHDYTPDELAVWVQRIRACNPARVWAYFNNDFGGHAIQNAKELIRQLAESSVKRGSR